MPGSPVTFVGPGSHGDIDSQPADAGAELGVDLVALPDLDPAFPLQAGFANLGEALARRLMTPRGGLEYDLDYGTDIRGRLNDSLTNDELADLQGSVEAEVLKDPRVLDVDVRATFIASAFTLRLEIRGATAAGPFALVLAVDRVTVALLEAA